jgi:hypothetical protein
MEKTNKKIRQKKKHFSTPTIQKKTLKEEHKSEIKERSEEELLEEEIKNQQTLESFIESEKNWN